MSYDLNSFPARKGTLGEQIVKKILERDGWHVQKPDGVSEDTATHIDWLCTRGKEIRCVEVKTLKKFLYSFVELPTFKIPLAKYDAYKLEAEKRGGQLELWFVSSEDGKIYFATSKTLDKKFRRAGFAFPVNVTFEDDDIEICFHVGQFDSHAIDDDDLAKLRAIDAEAATINRINGVLLKVPKVLNLSNGITVEFFLAASKLFFFLPHLERAGVDVSLIPPSKCYVIEDYPPSFVTVDEMFEILSEQKNPRELFDWWTTSGQRDVHKMHEEFLTAQDFLRKYLNIDLPDEWVKLEDMGDALVKQLKPLLENLPVCYLRKVNSAMYKFVTSPEEKALTGKVSDECLRLRQERPAPLKNTPDVVRLTGCAKKFSEVQTPNGMTLELFTAQGKILVHGAQLAVACGYPNQSGTTSDNSDLSKAVNVVAKFYAVRRNSADVKAKRFIAIDDVPAVLYEFLFNRTLDEDRCKTTVELLRWWQVHYNS